MRKFLLCFLASLFPLVALGQAVGSGHIDISLSDTADTFTATASSGSNGVAFSHNGARLDLGEGASDYLSSDGTTITTPVALVAIGGFTGAVTGNASTATALAADPTDCGVGEYATTIAASGNLTCATLSGALAGNASTATALAADPTDCGVGEYATTIAASGNLTCATLSGALAGNASTATALAADPTDCGVGEYATTIAASGNLTCATLSGALAGNASTATALAADPTDCGVGEYATTIAASGNLTCATLSGALAGNASTATALAADPTDCGVGEYATTIAASGNLTCATLSGTLAGNASTATALAADPTDCGVGEYATTIAASGNLTCATLSGALAGNASTATALAADPTDCGAGTYANTIAASGNLTCATVAVGEVTGAAPLATPTFTTSATIQGSVSSNGVTSTALATPVNAAFSQTDAGGTLLDSTTYYYRVVATTAAGGVTLPSTETSQATSGSGGNAHTVVVNWAAVTGAYSYKVYCRTTSAEQLCATIASPTLTWTDTGAVSPSGALPTLNTTGQLSAPYLVIDAPATTSPFSIKINGVPKLSMDTGGGILTGGTVTVGNGVVEANTATQLLLRGNTAATGGSVAITNGTTVTSGMIATFSPDSNVTPVFGVYFDGSIRFKIVPTLATCGSTIEGMVTRQKGLVSGVRTTLCMCTSDGGGTPAYAWKNITALFPNEAASIGTTTTCPTP